MEDFDPTRHTESNINIKIGNSSCQIGRGRTASQPDYYSRELARLVPLQETNAAARAQAITNNNKQTTTTPNHRGISATN
jgi:hypothetical protein